MTALRLARLLAIAGSALGGAAVAPSLGVAPLVGGALASLDDGTMMVVEGGKRHLGQGLDVVVTSGLPTSAGRMIFARPRVEEPGAGRDA